MDPVQVQPVQSNIVQPEPRESSMDKILKISLVILTIVLIGFGGYIFMSANKNKTSLDTKTIVSPTVTIKRDITITPTIAVTDDPNDINIGSVEADLKDIGVDVESLK